MSAMKRIYTLLALCLLFAACSKEEEKPTPEPLNYDYTGRVYAKTPQDGGLWAVYDFDSSDSAYYYLTRNGWDGEYVTGLKHPRGYSFDSINGTPVIVLKAYSIIDDTIVWNYKIVDNERFVEFIYDEDNGCYYEGNIFDRMK